MFPRPQTNFWSISSGLSLVARRARLAGELVPRERVLQRVDGDMVELLDLAQLVGCGDEHLPERTGIDVAEVATLRRSRSPRGCAAASGLALGRPAGTVRDMPKCTTSTSPSSRCRRTYLPRRSTLVIFLPASRSENSLRRAWRRITRIALRLRADLRLLDPLADDLLLQVPAHHLHLGQLHSVLRHPC